MQPDFDQVAKALDPQRRQLERRSEARRQKVLRRNPVTGRFMLAMSDEPTAETAFDHGEPWQRWVAELVREAFPDGVFLFNRRRGIDRFGDIDIVAIVSTGVWAIDIQRHDGSKVGVRRRAGSTGRRDFFMIDEVDCTSLLDDVDDQAKSVVEGLGRAGYAGVACNSVLCLIDVQPGWRGHSLVGDTYVTKARPMVKLLATGPVVFDDVDVASLGLALDKQLHRQHYTP